MSNSRWAARIRCKPSSLSTNFSILIFIGPVPPDSEAKHWRRSPSYAGSESIMAGPGEDDGEVEGFVQLNHVLLKPTSVGCLDAEKVVPYLTDHLDWRVKQVDGTIVELDSLEVVVLETPFSIPPGGNQPDPGEPIYHYGITYGRPGGSRRP